MNHSFVKSLWPSLLLLVLITSRAQALPGKAETLIQKMQQGQVTAMMLTDGLGSPDAAVRRQAAEAIAALREHYVQVIEKIVATENPRKLSPQCRWYALDTLAFLRPTDPEALHLAAQNFLFVWRPPPAPRSVINGFPDGGQEIHDHAATDIFIRAGLPALPLLADLLAADPRPEDSKALDCAATLLGPAASEWLTGEAAQSVDPEHQAALRSAAAFVARQTPAADLSQPPPFLSRFGSRGAMEEVFDDSQCDVLYPQARISWDMPTALADDTLVRDGSRTQPRCAWASERIRQTLTLLVYIIDKRLPSDSRGGKRYPPYPQASLADAVRVLGSLRSPLGAYAVWGVLEFQSFHQVIADDPSEVTAACLRAFGQIDLPAAKLLANRVLHINGPEQERAAVFALSHILGRLALPLLRQEAVEYQNDAGYRTQLADVIARGQDKNWYGGDWYGRGDPDAYALRFPTAPAGPVL